MKKKLLRWLAYAASAFALIQLLPYGKKYANPPIKKEPAWNAPQTRELAKRACFDCHSNETRWPWYSKVAPVSWLVQHDVDKGREKLNFSEWDRPQKEAGESAESVEEGEMPPLIFLVAHPEARLSPSEKGRLVQGFKVTLGERGDNHD